ncbi:LysR family transcriptional regulator [Enterovirga rhinocerotis]|uniref:LysR family transcriptional regulator n=1 Tax=Enterovirga rhinocerotis TaxID=1339210 RepID=A0A4V3DXC4_9HYPH|nr:LysR family transcriptional regulator [Enterovirga rhinocerotis]TDR88189.1 LysR family transcriptional regulator [Enterovirga rhinocerotis]
MGEIDTSEQLGGVSLQQIVTFLTIAETRSFRAAAERLHISQSALSVRVRQLEAALGVVLLHRTTRSVHLTLQGRSAQTSLQRVCSDLQRVVRDLRDEAALQRGSATVAVLPSLAITLLPGIMQAFAEAHPGVEIRLRDADSKSALAMVRRGDVDMSIQSRPDQLDGLLFERMFDDEFVVVLPREGASSRKRVRIEELRGRSLLLNPRGVDLRESLESLFAQAALTVSPTQELVSSSALVALVSAGFGVTILPKTALSGLQLSGCRIAALDPKASREVGIVVKPERSRSPPVLALRTFIPLWLDALPAQAGGASQARDLSAS